jgi:hypothetical protein
MKKILILSANPKDTSKLRLDEEVRNIQAAFKRAKNREQFEIITEWAVRVEDLRRALLHRNHTQLLHHRKSIALPPMFHNSTVYCNTLNQSDTVLQTYKYRLP